MENEKIRISLCRMLGRFDERVEAGDKRTYSAQEVRDIMQGILDSERGNEHGVCQAGYENVRTKSDGFSG